MKLTKGNITRRLKAAGLEISEPRRSQRVRGYVTCCNGFRAKVDLWQEKLCVEYVSESLSPYRLPNAERATFFAEKLRQAEAALQGTGWTLRLDGERLWVTEGGAE